MTQNPLPTTLQDLQSDHWQHIGTDGFSGLVGGLWIRHNGEAVTAALVTGEQHCNHYPETVHGGVLMTFADNALGYAVVRALGGSHCFTVSLQTQFVASARVGEVLCCQPEVVRRTRSLVFVRGLVTAGGRTVAVADGIWKVLDNGA